MLRTTLAIIILLSGLGSVQADQWWKNSFDPSPRILEARKAEQRSSTNAQEPADDHKRGTQDDPIIIRMLDPQNYNSIAAELKKDRDERETDSQSQWLFNLLLVSVGAVQAGAIIYTALVTNKAANAAVVAANAAERGLNEFERPWLFVSSVSIRWRERETIGQPIIFNNWFAKLHWKNIGRSPAIVESCLFGIVEKAALPLKPSYDSDMQLSVQKSIGVDEIVETSEAGPAPGTEAELILYGCITYKEVNGKIHKTGFAIEMWKAAPAYAPHQSDEYNYYT